MDNNGTLETIDEWAKHLVDFAQGVYDRTDTDNPRHHDIVNLLCMVKCLPEWVKYDRRHYSHPVPLPLRGAHVVCQNMMNLDE